MHPHGPCTPSGVERVLQRNPGYDVHHLLHGTTAMLHGLVKSFSYSPCYMMEAVEPLPMAVADRKVASEALQDAVRVRTQLASSGFKLCSWMCACIVHSRLLLGTWQQLCWHFW